MLDRPFIVIVPAYVLLLYKLASLILFEDYRWAGFFPLSELFLVCELSQFVDGMYCLFKDFDVLQGGCSLTSFNVSDRQDFPQLDAHLNLIRTLGTC
jgi:hypothetical protein